MTQQHDDRDIASGASDLDRPIGPISDAAVRTWVRRLRALAVVGLIIGAWVFAVLVVVDANEYGMESGDVAYVVFYVGVALVLTVMLGWSLRSSRLRSALAPLEFGALVGLVAWVSTVLFPDGDPYGGQEFFAAGIGIAAILVWVVGSSLAKGRSRERAWLIGIGGALVVGAMALPPIGNWLDGVGSYGAYGGVDSDSRLARSFAADGSFSLSPYDAVSVASLDGGYEPQASRDSWFDDPASVPIVDPAMGVAVNAAPATASAEPLGTVDLRVRADGSIRLATDLAATNGGAPLTGAILRGGCDDPGDRVGAGFPVTTGAEASVDVDVTLDDLATSPRLVLVVGTGDSLAPVRCIDLVDRSSLAAAQLGAAEFGARCIEPLGIREPAPNGLVAASFQDASCAAGWTKLVRVAAGQYVSDEVGAAIRSCLEALDVDGDAVQDLPGPESLVDASRPELATPHASNCWANSVPGGMGSVDASGPMAPVAVAPAT